MKRILAIEAHLETQKRIQAFLIEHNYKIDIASSGTEGILKFQKNSYDLILLNAILPDIDGYSTCQIIRGQSNIPIIMLSECYDKENEIRAFELGIDDYITKPFHHTVFIKRIEAILRRGLPSETEKNMGILQFNELMLNFPAYTAYINGEKVELTTKEFEIIAMFLQNQGKVLSRSDLLDKVWGYEYYGDVRVIDTHIKNLRKKLNIPYIKTVKGIGYKLDS